MLDRLEEIFQANQYPDTALQDETAHSMGVTTEKISIWFQNRRSKFKRESKSSHVMWMRKQIFEAGDGGGVLSPYGGPRLPELTGGLCHVLSPLEPASCSRWETQNTSLCGMPTFRDPTCSLLDLQSTPNSPTPTDQSYIDMPNNSVVFSENSGYLYDSLTNVKTCNISETPNTNSRKHSKIPSIRDQDGFVTTLHRPPLLPMTTSNHHVNRTSTPNSCRLACPTRLDFCSPQQFNEGISDVQNHNNYSFYGNSSFHGNKTTPQLSTGYSQPPPAHRKSSDSCSKKHKYPLANMYPTESQFPLADGGLPFGDKFPSVVNNYQLADDKFPTASDSSLFQLPWQ